jgi:signal transduction histidine kinase
MDLEHFIYLPKILNGLCCGVIVLDSSETVVVWNSWLERHSAISSDQAIGELFQDLFPDMRDGRVHEAIRSAIQFQYPAIVSNVLNKMLFPIYSYSQKEKSIIQQVVRVTPLRLEDSDIYCLVEITDVTAAVAREKAFEHQVAERKRSEAQLRDREKALLRSNEELESFAFSASHDLQEPLRKVQAFGDRLLLRYEKTLGQEGRDYIRRMQAAVNRMSQLIDDLLLLSRVNTRGKSFESTDLNDVLSGVLSDLEMGINKTGARIVVNKLLKVVADPVQMRQIFQNLIGNALKFRDPNIPPIVKVSAEMIESPIDHDGMQGPTCRIFVEDNGIGFDPRYAERIFKVFQRLHGRGVYEGTGIGLAICSKIAERHGGSLKAYSRPGKGAVFIMTIKMSGNNTNDITPLMA